VIKEFSETTLSQKEFCQERELSAKYFSLQRAKLLGTRKSKNRLLKASVSAEKSSSNLTLKLSYGELCFDSSVDPTYLAALIRKLS